MKDKAGIGIGIITRGNVSIKWMTHMEKLKQFFPIGMFWKYIIVEGTDGWAVNRNEVVRKAKKENFEYIMWIDDDVFIPKDAVRRMIASGKDIITGIYWTKTEHESPVIFEHDGSGPMYDFELDKQFKIAGSGLGCCLVKTKVFDDFDKAGIPYFKENWIMEMDDGRKMKCSIGEDHYFFFNARKLGYEVWADSGLLCDHYDMKNKTFHPSAETVRKLTGKKLEEVGREDIIKDHNNQLGLNPDKKTIVILNKATNAFSGDELEKRGLGGAETCIINLARTFSKEFNVHVFCNCPNPGVFDSVIYHDMKDFNAIKELNADLMIVSRNTDPLDFKKELNVKQVVLWAHDIPKDPSFQFLNESHMFFDKIVALTNNHKEEILKTFPIINSDKVIVIEHGVDVNRFKDTSIKKIPGRLIYSSTPYRGLEILGKVFPKIKERVPHATLSVFSSMKVYGASYNDDEFIPLYDSLKKIDGIEYRESIKQDELAKEFMKAEVLAYPNSFPETYCLVGNTKVAIPGGNKYIKDINIGDTVYGYSHKKDMISFGKVKKQWLARKKAPVYKVNYIWGIGCNAKKKGHIIGTGDHRILMKDKTYKKISDLKVNDRVMPFYRNREGKGKYITINLNNGDKCYEHDFIGKELLGAVIKKGKNIIHHKDNNGLNNSVDNLMPESQSIHASEHILRLSKKERELRSNKISTKVKSFYSNPKNRENMSKRAKKVWKDMTMEQYNKILNIRKKGLTPDIIKMQVKGLLKHNEDIKVVIDEKELIKKYLDEKKSMIQIARELKTSDGIVKRNLQNYGIHIRDRSEAQLIRQNHRIESIEFYGYEDVYDIEVEGIHNFVANDIIVHNCLTAIEAMKAGTPIVTSDYAALKDTITDDVGIKVDGNPYSEEYQNKFVDSVVELLTNKDKWTKMSNACLSKDVSWEKAAKKWIDIFFQDPDSIRQVGNINTQEYWDGVYERELSANHIRTDSERPDLIMKEFNGGNVLDVGCGTGELTREFRRNFPNAEIWGSDFSMKAIDYCRQQNKTIFYANHPLLNKEYDKKYFDMITIMHVLEHLDKPEELIERAKELLKDDGKLIIALPINDEEWREHLKIWKIDDVLKLLSKFKCEYLFNRVFSKTRKYKDGRPFEEIILVINFV